MINSSSQPPEDSLAGIKKLFGSLLILCGLFVGGWTFFQIYSLLTTTQEIPLVQKLVPSQAAERLIITREDKIELPPSFFSFIAHALALGLLLIAVILTNGLVRAGASLLQADLRSFVERMRTELQGWLRKS